MRRRCGGDNRKGAMVDGAACGIDGDISVRAPDRSRAVGTLAHDRRAARDQLIAGGDGCAMEGNVAITGEDLELGSGRLGKIGGAEAGELPMAEGAVGIRDRAEGDPVAAQERMDVDIAADG